VSRVGQSRAEANQVWKLQASKTWREDNKMVQGLKQGQTFVHVTAKMRQPEWFWRAVAFPFHSLHYIVYHGSGHIGNMLGMLTNKIIVEKIETRPATEEELDEYEDQVGHLPGQPIQPPGYDFDTDIEPEDNGGMYR